MIGPQPNRDVLVTKVGRVSFVIIVALFSGAARKGNCAEPQSFDSHRSRDDHGDRGNFLPARYNRGAAGDRNR